MTLADWHRRVNLLVALLAVAPVGSVGVVTGSLEATQTTGGRG